MITCTAVIAAIRCCRSRTIAPPKSHQKPAPAVHVTLLSEWAQEDTVRHWLGDWPTNFLKARLNAASDS